MFAGNQRRYSVPPIEVDCQVIRLPTVAGLSHESEEWETNSNMDMWNALAAAVMSDDGFDEDAFERGRDYPVADVIDLDSYR